MSYVNVQQRSKIPKTIVKYLNDAMHMASHL